MGYPARTDLTEDTSLLTILTESFHKVHYVLEKMPGTCSFCRTENTVSRHKV